MNSSHVWFFLLAISIYFVVIDSSIARAVDLVFRMLKFRYERIKWWCLNSPDNIIVRWMIDRRSMQTAREFMKEFENK